MAKIKYGPIARLDKQADGIDFDSEPTLAIEVKDHETFFVVRVESKDWRKAARAWAYASYHGAGWARDVRLLKAAHGLIAWADEVNYLDQVRDPSCSSTKVTRDGLEAGWGRSRMWVRKTHDGAWLMGVEGPYESSAQQRADCIKKALATPMNVSLWPIFPVSYFGDLPDCWSQVTA